MQTHSLAIIGAGNVGASLGETLRSAGYSVTYGVTGPDGEAKARQRLGAEATLRSVRDAAAAADIIFLAVPGQVAADAASALGPHPGKVLVDCTNPVRWQDGPVLAPPPEGSNAAAIQSRVAGSRVVKGFNTFGAEFHANPVIDGRPVDVLLASDHVEATALVASVATRAGFRPIDAGPLRNAVLLESMAVLWIHLATTGGQGREVAFALRHRPPTAI